MSTPRKDCLFSCVINSLVPFYIVHHGAWLWSKTIHYLKWITAWFFLVRVSFFFSERFYIWADVAMWVRIGTTFIGALYHHLGLVERILEHPQVLGDLYYSAKLCRNLHNCFYNIKIWIFHLFGLKTPIHAPPLNGVLGVFDHLNREQYQCNPQKAHPCTKRSRIWHTDRRNRSNCVTCARNQETLKRTKNLRVAN